MCQQRSSTSLLDHLVGAGEQHWRHVETKHHCDRKVLASSNLIDRTTGRSEGFR